MQESTQTLVKRQDAADEIEAAIIADATAIPYVPNSTCPPLNTLIPLSLFSETVEAQSNILQKLGQTFDAYVQSKLKYSSKVALCSAFAAEQIDAIATAIYQIENNKKGLILADMAGIGKGRVGAGILRYAYQNGYIPVFITEKDNLFSDFYRDVFDIGGFDKNKIPTPLILNGYKSGKKINESGEQEIGSSEIVRDGKVIFSAQQKKELLEILNSGLLPKEYDIILSTYDQFSIGGLRDLKQNFLYNNAEKLIIVLDECHNAAGSKSKAGEFFTSLTAASSGCLFMSATFSKRPDNIFLYVNKTDISESNIPTDILIKSVQQGGEKLIEYLSSALARSGQLLRRQRGFAGCGLNTIYTQDEDVIELYEQFDLCISKFLELLEFCGVKNKVGNSFKSAKMKSINRFANLKKVELADVNSKPKLEKKSDTGDLINWYKENEGKYMYEYYAGNLSSSLFSFVENLLFSLKAKLVSDAAKLELTNIKSKNKALDGSIIESNRKPIIAVRNTLESIYETLGITLGSEYDSGDFSKYIQSLFLSSQKGAIRLTEVKLKDLMNKLEQKEKGKKYGKVIKEDDWQIQNADYEDGGKEFRELYAGVESLKLKIPLSPIDAIIEAIESTNRVRFDLDENENQNYVVGEVTGRKYRFIRTKNGKYMLIKNPKEDNKFTTFQKYNNGFYDALIINESGSTGASAHSSPLFKDKRPRSLIIHQVELDINTEVQKRGRINRTGQLYYPTYVYAVSRIPSEIRRLNMMLQKLRSLDAGVTANQKQSAKDVEILDRNNNPIKDIINKYGTIALNTFLSDVNNEQYRKYEASDSQRAFMSDENIVTAFLRNIELLPAATQETIYDSLNSIYTEEVNKAIEAKTYTEETVYQDLKATPKNRVVIKFGENTSPFNEPVFEEDNFVNRLDRPLSKDEYEDLSIKLTGGERVDKWYEGFKTKFEDYFYKEYYPNIPNTVPLQPLEEAQNELEKQAIEIENKERIKRAQQRAIETHETLKDIIDYFYPLKPVKIPEDFDLFFQKLMDDDSKIKINYAKGVFLGYKISDNGSANKYSAMNIELIFAQLTGTSKVSIRPTSVKGKPNTEILFDIMAHEPNSYELKEISMWDVNTNERILAKFLTGNILDAYQDAMLRVQTDDYKSKIEFTKFTTYPEDILRFGIRLYMYKYVEANPNRTKTALPINSKELVGKLQEVADEYDDEHEIILLDKTQSICLKYKKDDYSRSLSLIIFGGLAGGKGEKRAYKNKLYDSDEFWNITAKDYYEDVFKIQIGGTRKNINYRSLTIYGTAFSENDLDMMQKYFDYIYQNQSTFLNIGLGETLESLYDLEDVRPKTEEELEEEGNFQYYLIKSYSKELFSSYNKFMSYEPSEIYANGVVNLKAKPSIKEIISYGLAPVSISSKEIYSNIISLLSDNEKIRFVNEINEMIKLDTPPIEIYLYIERLVKNKVYSLQQIFGYIAKNLVKSGQIIIDYILMPESPESQEKMEVQKVEKIEQEFEEKEVISLNLGTAQDFLILMNYNI
jgi:hypothetical protein